jgi:hypothetical protein
LRRRSYQKVTGGSGFAVGIDKQGELEYLLRAAVYVKLAILSIKGLNCFSFSMKTLNRCRKSPKVLGFHILFSGNRVPLCDKHFAVDSAQGQASLITQTQIEVDRGQKISRTVIACVQAS